jgi:hypothetical protein
MNNRFSVFIAPLLIATALTSSLALAHGDDNSPAKPECPRGQVLDKNAEMRPANQ